MPNHPNATAAGLTTAIASLAVWIAAQYGHTLDEQWALWIAGGAATFVLFVGRRGIKGAALGVWNGLGAAWGGPAKKTPAAPKP